MCKDIKEVTQKRELVAFCTESGVPAEDYLLSYGVFEKDHGVVDHALEIAEGVRDGHQKHLLLGRTHCSVSVLKDRPDVYDGEQAIDHCIEAWDAAKSEGASVAAKSSILYYLAKALFYMGYVDDAREVCPYALSMGDNAKVHGLLSRIGVSRSGHKPSSELPEVLRIDSDEIPSAQPIEVALGNAATEGDTDSSVDEQLHVGFGSGLFRMLGLAS
jgi:hypothetical protein